MLKEQNFFRDILFALALIGLIRLTYKNYYTPPKMHSLTFSHKAQKDISGSALLKETKTELDRAYSTAQERKDIPLQKDIQKLLTQWQTIKDRYEKTDHQESVLTGFLGPIYTASKIAKDRLLKKQLERIQSELTTLMKEVRIHQEKTSLQTSTGPL